MSDFTQNKRMTLHLLRYQEKRDSLRRYYLCNKDNKKKKRMDSDEVATDYKLKQFLNDVQKFSGRSKLREEKHSKHLSSHKNEGKRKGLFENGMISRPSMKGMLGFKNKARLTGNLENLLNEEINSVGCPNGERNSEEQDDPEESNASGEEVEISRDNKKIKSWGKKFLKKPEDKIKPNSRGECSRGNKAEDLIENVSLVKDLDDIIKYTEKRDQDIIMELKNTLPNVPMKSKEEFLFECQKNLVSALQKDFLEKALNDKESIFDNLKHILEEYIKSKKPHMIDKSQQTSFPNDVWEKSNTKEVNTSGNCFFDSMAPKEEVKPFGFHPIRETNTEILTPLIKGPMNPLFEKKTTERIIETPQEFKNSEGWPPTTAQRKDKFYIPAILSPPSPGREYSFDFLPGTNKPLTPLHGIPTIKSGISCFEDQNLELSSPSLLLPLTSRKSQEHFSRFHLSSKKNLMCHSGFKKLPKENKFNFIDLNKPPCSFQNFEQTDKLLKESSSFSKNFLFRKRAKLQFSPHRL